MIDVLVTRKQREADHIFSFELVRVDGGRLPAFTAGAHIDVHLANGLVRQYSLYNQPGEVDRYCIAVLAAAQSRGGSRYLTETVQQGDLLRIGAPRNLFPLDENARSSLLVAGGIGVTPILAMAARLHQCGKHFALHYCGRTITAMAFREALLHAPYADRVHIYADDGAPAQSLDATSLIARAPAGSHLYVCGPAGFMDGLLAAGRDAGWEDARLHREYFAADAPLPASKGNGFILRLMRTGRDLPVPEDKSVADVLLENGVDIPLSCEQGVCGTCLLPVVAGEPDHRDMFLTDAEHTRNDCFTPCCSRSKSLILSVDL